MSLNHSKIYTAVNALSEKSFSGFVYDVSVFSAKMQEIKTILDVTNKDQVYYSLKSNPNPRIVQELKSHVDGFDVSSLTEYRFLLSIGIPPESISVSGPGKCDELLGLLAKNISTHIHLDSKEELLVLEKMTNLEDLSLSIRLDSEQQKTNKLGFTKQEALDTFKAYPNLQFKGIHFYLGRESYIAENIYDYILELEGFMSINASSFVEEPKLFIGPGLPLDLSDSKKLKASKSARCFELGRALVGPAGFYFSDIECLKQDSKGQKLLTIEGGVQHLGTPIFSYFRGKNEHEIIFQEEHKKSSSLCSYSLYGSLCLWRDCLHPRMEAPSDLNLGDRILVSNMGAYGLTAAVSFFIGKKMPREFIFENNKLVELKNTWRTYHEEQRDLASD